MLDEKVVEVMYLTNFTIPVHDKLSKRDLRARNKETVSSAFINIQHWYKAVLILILNIEYLPSLHTNIGCEPCIIKALA